MKGGTPEAFATHRLMMIRLGIGLVMVVVGLIWLLIRWLTKTS